MLAEELTATTAGARTVEAFGLQRAPDRGEPARRSTRPAATRLRTLSLRTVFFPAVEVVLRRSRGRRCCWSAACCYVHGAVSLGAVVAAALYLRQLVAPLDSVLIWIEQLQSSSASFARVEGLGRDPARPPAGRSAAPADDRIEVAGVRYAYDDGRDVLHGVDLTVRPGERLALVGPSGAGQVHAGPAARRRRRHRPPAR